MTISASHFVRQTSELSFANTFNPYKDRCSVYDYVKAPQWRRRVLRDMLLAATKQPLDSLWVGRDLGYRGGRRTGLALTDDVHYQAHLKRWGIQAQQPTKGRAVPERTAAIIWEMLAHLPQPIFTWNVFPLQPHDPENPFSNRAHNAQEREAGVAILDALIGYLQPKYLVAIGNDAHRALERVSGKRLVVRVRHPSYGGQTVFLRQIRELYRL